MTKLQYLRHSKADALLHQVFKQEAYEQMFLEQIEKLKASKSRAMNGNS